jgi:hypothetical protein
MLSQGAPIGFKSALGGSSSLAMLTTPPAYPFDDDHRPTHHFTAAGTTVDGIAQGTTSTASGSIAAIETNDATRYCLYQLAHTDKRPRATEPLIRIIGCVPSETDCHRFADKYAPTMPGCDLHYAVTKEPMVAARSVDLMEDGEFVRGHVDAVIGRFVTKLTASYRSLKVRKDDAHAEAEALSRATTAEEAREATREFAQRRLEAEAAATATTGLPSQTSATTAALPPGVVTSIDIGDDAPTAAAPTPAPAETAAAAAPTSASGQELPFELQSQCIYQFAVVIVFPDAETQMPVWSFVDAFQTVRAAEDFLMDEVDEQVRALADFYVLPMFRWVRLNDVTNRKIQARYKDKELQQMLTQRNEEEAEIQKIKAAYGALNERVPQIDVVYYTDSQTTRVAQTDEHGVVVRGTDVPQLAPAEHPRDIINREIALWGDALPRDVVVGTEWDPVTHRNEVTMKTVPLRPDAVFRDTPSDLDDDV